MSLQAKSKTLAFASTPFTTSIERRVLTFIRKHGTIAAGERVVVAVSGGPDSTALLVILARLATKLRLDLTAVHFNHQLRTDDETTGDLDFVRSLTSSIGVTLAHSSADVRRYAREGHRSVEDAARRLRYAFLAEEASRIGASCIAVGHTLDDQAETVLLHLIRGSGLTGASGMPPRARWPFNDGPELTRPLLELRRTETAHYCTEIGVAPRNDSSNDLRTATRNRVRHEAIPVLRRLNPRIEEALARFSAAARTDGKYLDELATEAFNSLATVHTSAVSLPRRELAALPRALASRLIRFAFVHAYGIAADLEGTHLEAILEALDGPPISHCLPGGVIATIDQRSLVLTRGSIASPSPVPTTTLSIPGLTDAGSWSIEISLEPPPATIITQTPFEGIIDADRIGGDLTVRSRRPGDRLRPLGLGGEKKLQDILVDAKVPARDRDAIPLVCARDQIVWVVGYCLDERFALGPESRRAMRIRFHVS